MPFKDDDDDTYTVPLKDIRAFGAGLKRKRVQFVPSSSAGGTTTTATSESADGTSVADQYLSLVLSAPAARSAHSRPPAGDPLQPSPEVSPQLPTCEICRLPIHPTTTTGGSGTPHEASLAHQVCQPHSHPPSALDRTRKGLAILAAHGWDPDARAGLGAAGEGILHPVRAREKRDTVGLGMEVKGRGREARQPAKVRKLNAKEVRKMEREERRKRERLQELFYYDVDVEKYLGPQR